MECNAADISGTNEHLGLIGQSMLMAGHLFLCGDQELAWKEAERLESLLKPSAA